WNSVTVHNNVIRGGVLKGTPTSPHHSSVREFRTFKTGRSGTCCEGRSQLAPLFDGYSGLIRLGPCCIYRLEELDDELFFLTNTQLRSTRRQANQLVKRCWRK